MTGSRVCVLCMCCVWCVVYMFMYVYACAYDVVWDAAIEMDMLTQQQVKGVYLLEV